MKFNFIPNRWDQEDLLVEWSSHGLMRNLVFTQEDNLFSIEGNVWFDKGKVRKWRIIQVEGDYYGFELIQKIFETYQEIDSWDIENLDRRDEIP